MPYTKIKNYDWICEELRDADHESFSVDGSGSYDEMISVLLTKNFELDVIRHHRSYNFTEDVLYVLYSFECETYEVSYEDIVNFLTDEQEKSFQRYLLTNATMFMELDNEALEEFFELSEEHLYEVKNYMYDNCLVLETFEEFDKNLYDAYLASIYEQVDLDEQVNIAKENMYRDLYLFDEEIS